MPESAAGRTPNGGALRAHADARARALAPLIAEIREGGAGTFAAIARQLNQRNSQTSYGNHWTGTTVRSLVMRLETLMNVSATARANIVAERQSVADARARLLASLIIEISEGRSASLVYITQKLNERGSLTSDGKAWTYSKVRRVLMRLKIL